MAEEPVKLFSTRAERYPQPNDIDTTRTVLEKTAERVPLFGPATVQVIGQFLVPGVERRREEWFKELADDFDRLKETVDGFSVENLAQNEAFVSATIQATRIAIGTHKEEKRQMLRNALLKIAIGASPQEEQQQMFLRYIDEFGPTHMKVLELLATLQEFFQEKRRKDQSISTYRRTIGERFPELQGQPDWVRQVLFDLSSRGLSTVKDPEESLMDMPAVTGYGQAFLEFVSSPISLRASGK